MQIAFSIPKPRNDLTQSFDFPPAALDHSCCTPPGQLTDEHLDVVLQTGSELQASDLCNRLHNPGKQESWPANVNNP